MPKAKLSELSELSETQVLDERTLLKELQFWFGVKLDDHFTPIVVSDSEYDALISNPSWQGDSFGRTTVSESQWTSVEWLMENVHHDYVCMVCDMYHHLAFVKCRV